MATLADLYRTWPHTREVIMNLSRMPSNMRENADYYLANPKGKTETALAAEIEADAQAFLVRIAMVESMKSEAPAGFAAALTALGLQDAEITNTIGVLKTAATKIQSDMKKPQKAIAKDVADFKAAIPVYAEPAAADIPERFRVK